VAAAQPAEGALIGRRPQCALLESALSRLASGEPVFVEIVGEPGIGKTRLLAELADRALARRVITLSGRATERTRAISLAAFADAIDDHLAKLRPSQLRDLTEGPVGWLGTSFTAMERVARPVPGGPAVPSRLSRAMRLLLERLASPTGLVLLLDDMHWADRDTVELLAQLGRRPPRAAVLLAVAYRPRQLSSAQAAALVGTQPVRVEVGPLTPTEADELVGPRLPRGIRRHLYARAGGNPLYLRAMAAARLACGRAPGMVMGTATRDLLAELATLSPHAMRMARAGAVAGDPFEAGTAGVAAGLAGQPISAVALRGLDELAARDVIRPDGLGPRFRFRHPIVRQIVYLSAGAGWRIAAHTRVAAYLRDQGEEPVMLARHVEHIAESGDESAAAVLVDAAHAVLERAPAVAGHWLRASLQLLRADPAGSTRRLSLLADLAHAYGLAGRLAASRAVCHRLLDHLPVEQATQRARVVASCALADRLLGRHEESRALLLSVLDTLPEQAAMAGLSFEMAAGCLMRTDYAANRAWAARSLALARRHGDRPVQAAALGFLAMASHADRDGATASALLDQAADLVDATSNRELAGRLDAALWLGWNEVCLARVPRAVRHLERAVTLAHATGQAHLRPLLSVCMAMALRWQGQLTEAARHAENAVDAAELSGSAELRTIAYATQSWVASWTGDVALALGAASTAVTGAAQMEGWFPGVAVGMLARARIFAGRPAGCVEMITGSLGGGELSAADPWSRVSWYEVLVRAELASGRVAQAAEWVSRAENATPTGSLWHAGLARLARAQVLATEERPEAASEQAAEAARVLAGAGCRLDAARAELLTGVTDPSPRAGRGALHRAEELFIECGAQAMARQARRELRRRAARQPDRGAAPLDLPGLTARQAEVSRLVAVGLTNQEIARRLAVSSKTVEVHLSNVFGRLGVTSRAGLASYVSSKGLA
jgi:DNA-binding CsgD family transcriptional regulator